MSDSTNRQRPERRTRELPNGDTAIEAGDCQFVASPSGTVHKRGEWDGDEYDYEYHPLCGQRLSGSSMWRSVEADTEEEAVLKYNYVPCTKCVDKQYRLERWRKKKHSSLVMDHVDLPERWSE